jgi:hypothetical protein
MASQVKVQPYRTTQAKQWDQFVDSAKNSSFLFLRGYMDYHADRFTDASWIATDANDQWIAVLPACVVHHGEEKRLSSHAGLSYGGWVTDGSMTQPTMLSVFEVWLDTLRALGYRRVLYKALPSIYHHPQSAQEDLYALFRVSAQLVRRDTLSVLDLHSASRVQERRKRGAKKAASAGVGIELDGGVDAIAAFWPCLEDNLAQTHGAKPVHSLAEMRLLAERFPQNIRAHTASFDGRLCAGVVSYRNQGTLHMQYISASPEGKQLGALDALFAALIASERQRAGSRWLDFGNSNTEQGRVLNVGLVEQKEGFGARTVVQDFYDIPLC